MRLSRVGPSAVGPGKLVVVILADSGDRYLSKCFDDDWLKDLMKRVVAAKYSGIALTVDLPYYGNRERISTTQLAVRRDRVEHVL